MMKFRSRILFKSTEAYLPQTDGVFFRLNALILKHIEDGKFEPTKEFSINFEKDVEADEFIKKIRAFADAIENAST